MTRATTSPCYPGHRQKRFSDEMFFAPPEPKPAATPVAGERCPFCDQPVPHGRTSIWRVFCGGLQRLVVAVTMIIGALLRCVRLAVAAALCLVGLVGFCCRSLGLYLAHPHDRWLLGGRDGNARGITRHGLPPCATCATAGLSSSARVCR